MPLETGDGYISGLVQTNPVGATDHKSTADDHLRLIKAALKGSFPNVAGAISADHTELSLLDGVTGVTGTGNLVLDTAPTISGTLTAGTFSGSGASLTSLNASSLASGTVPDARFPATLPALNGSALTSLTAANITGSNTLPDGVLSTNVPLLNAANTFTADQTISKSTAVFSITATGTTPAYTRLSRNSSVYGYIGTSELITGSGAGDLCLRAEGGGISMCGTGGGSAPFLSLSATGTVTTANLSAAEVGYKGLPQNVQTGSTYTLVLSDAGKYIHSLNSSGDQAITVPPNSSVAFPIGTTIPILANNVGGTKSTIAQGAGVTIYLAGTGFGTSGTRTLANGGIATLMKMGSDIWIISGAGLT
jgi:hypothetical protein